MPILKRPSKKKYYTTPSRQALLAGDCEVLIVGGGPSGLGAAFGAAKAGARVILAERLGFLGGNATAALVMPLMSFHTQSFSNKTSPHHTTLFPDDHGPGNPTIKGALKFFLEKLVEAKGAIPPSLDTGYVVPFDPEIFKLVALEYLDELGVEFLFHAFAHDVFSISDSEHTNIKGIYFATKSGPLLIKSKSIVDCTGDGDIAALSGASYEIGRDADQLVQPMTLMFRVANFENKNFQKYIKDNPEQWRGVHGLWKLIEQASKQGDLKLEREDILMFATPHNDEISVNSTRVTRVLGTDIWDLTFAEFESRRQLRQITKFLQYYVPGFENSYVVQSGTTIGVRETRRIVGHYYLTALDLLELRRFDDVIAKGAYPLDIHNPMGSGTILKRIPPGESYDIPLRCLIPQKVENLLVAGRCISGSHEAHSSYRVMPISMATGQAAGVCAALSALQNIPPSQIRVKEVQKELVRQGAYLGELRFS